MCFDPDAAGCLGIAEERFQRGDANADRLMDISDASAILGFLFLGNPPALACEDSADVDDSGLLDITDAVVVLGHLFLGNPPPPAPFPSCGPDPIPDRLTCEGSDACRTTQ